MTDATWVQAGKEFRVVVADSRPHYEGRAMLSKLLAQGIPCTYLQLNALCYSMQARMPETFRNIPCPLTTSEIEDFAFLLEKLYIVLNFL